MSDPFVGAIISGAVSLFSMGEERDSGQAAGAAIDRQTQKQIESEKLQGRIAEVKNARERIEQTRQARIAAARIQAYGQSQGMGVATSGVSGSVGSVRSQMGTNVGFINQQETFAQQASMAMQESAQAGGEAARYMAEAQQWNTIGGLANQAFKDFGGWTTVFGGNTNKSATGGK